MRFHVHLNVFDGPLDLLFHLVRKQEVAISEISISTVTEQYLEHLTVLEQLDIDSVGDFIEVASTLIELKSRTVLSSTDEEKESVEEESREDSLVHRLLEYKAYRDAAHMLEERGRAWHERFSRQGEDAPHQVQSSVVPELPSVDGLEIWDLLSAFGRIMQNLVEDPIETIPYDTTPIAEFMRRLYRRLQCGEVIAFSSLFGGGAHRSTCIGHFLAVLELVRHGHALARQQELFAEIWIAVGSVPLPDTLEQIDSYSTIRTSSQDAS